MLPAFVIGLREGLETVVIVGAITVFVRAQGHSHLLPRIWRAVAVAAAICIAVGFVLRLVEVSLPWRQQEQFETLVGLAALLTVTYMVVWMRRFPKDLHRDTSTTAAAALARGSGRALVVLAFFAVLREGFEIAVFVVATISLTGRSAWLATGGAFLGVVVALAIGVGVVRGTTHLDVARFFRVTAFILVLTAAGIAMTMVHTANAAGWITFGQTPQIDLSWLAPPGSVLSSFTTGVLGIQPYPALIEMVAWVAYFVPMMAVVLWPKRPMLSLAPAQAGSGATASEPPSCGTPSRRRPVLSAGWLLTGGTVLALVVGLLAYWARPSTATLVRTKAVAAKAKDLFATLDGVTCLTVTYCIAVGDFLPVDKDAAGGDPDGDGQATHTLVESSDARQWRPLPSPDEGHGGAELSSVSCPTKGDCVAVGFYRKAPFGLQATNAPPSYPLIEAYDGHTWRVVASPGVAPNSVLVSVSCPTSSSCTAVGYTTTSIGPNPSESFFVENFDGQSWAVVPLCRRGLRILSSTRSPVRAVRSASPSATLHR